MTTPNGAIGSYNQVVGQLDPNTTARKFEKKSKPNTFDRQFETAKNAVNTGIDPSQAASQTTQALSLQKRPELYFLRAVAYKKVADKEGDFTKKEQAQNNALADLLKAQKLIEDPGFKFWSKDNASVRDYHYFGEDCSIDLIYEIKVLAKDVFNQMRETRYGVHAKSNDNLHSFVDTVASDAKKKSATKLADQIRSKNDIFNMENLKDETTKLPKLLKLASKVGGSAKRQLMGVISSTFANKAKELKVQARAGCVEEKNRQTIGKLYTQAIKYAEKAKSSELKAFDRLYIEALREEKRSVDLESDLNLILSSVISDTDKLSFDRSSRKVVLVAKDTSCFQSLSRRQDQKGLVKTLSLYVEKMIMGDQEMFQAMDSIKGQKLTQDQRVEFILEFIQKVREKAPQAYGALQTKVFKLIKTYIEPIYLRDSDPAKRVSITKDNIFVFSFLKIAKEAEVFNRIKDHILEKLGEGHGFTKAKKLTHATPLFNSVVQEITREVSEILFSEEVSSDTRDEAVQMIASISLTDAADPTKIPLAARFIAEILTTEDTFLRDIDNLCSLLNTPSKDPSKWSIKANHRNYLKDTIKLNDAQIDQFEGYLRLLYSIRQEGAKVFQNLRGALFNETSPPAWENKGATDSLFASRGSSSVIDDDKLRVLMRRGINKVDPERVNALFVGNEHWNQYVEAIREVTLQFDAMNDFASKHLNFTPDQLTQLGLNPNKNIPSILITPIQRLPRWEMLVSEVNKKLDKIIDDTPIPPTNWERLQGVAGSVGHRLAQATPRGAAIVSKVSNQASRAKSWVASFTPRFASNLYSQATQSATDMLTPRTPSGRQEEERVPPLNSALKVIREGIRRTNNKKKLQEGAA